jgi:hypothetical protein
MLKIDRSMLTVACASLCLAAMPAWAGHGGVLAKSHHNGFSATTPSHGKGKHVVTDADDASGTDTDASTHPGSNKGGELRGLDRANQVAGEHGELGRINAAHHGKH